MKTDFGPRFSRGLKVRLLMLLAGNAGLLLLISVLIKDGGSFAQVLRAGAANVAPTLLAALGMTGIVFTGAIDLSIASQIALTGTVFGMLVHRGIAPGICFGACITTFWLCSMLNAWLIRGLRLPAIIITLGGLAFYRGLALIFADVAIPNFGGSLSIQNEAYHAPGKQHAILMLGTVLAGALLWERLGRMPREWLAFGSSKEACRLAGLKLGAVLQSAFFASGLFGGLAALLYLTRVQYIEPARIALGFELQVIGAVVLGGTNIFGGEGSFLGTALGACFLHLTTEALIYAGVSAYYQEAITGTLILAVIGTDCALNRKRKMMEELG